MIREKSAKPKGKKKILRIMKRLFLTVVAVLSMTMTFAENEKFSMDQAEAVQDIHSSFCADMMNAAGANADERESMVKKAVEKDLKYMRYVLTQDQYRKYLMLLNATFNNRGLIK